MAATLINSVLITGGGASGSPVSTSYTVPSSTTMLTVQAVMPTSGVKVMTSMAFAGSSMTQVAGVSASTSANNGILWGFANPTIGGPFTLSMGWLAGGSSTFEAEIAAWSGTTSFGAVVTTDSSPGSVASPKTDNITMAAGSVALDLMVINANRTPSIGPGATVVGSTNPGGVTYGAQYQANATSLTWSWTGGDAPFIHVIAEMLASSGGGGGTSNVPKALQHYRQMGD